MEFILGVSSTRMNYLLGVIYTINITMLGGDSDMVCWYYNDSHDE